MTPSPSPRQGKASGYIVQDVRTTGSEKFSEEYHYMYILSINFRSMHNTYSPPQDI